MSDSSLSKIKWEGENPISCDKLPLRPINRPFGARDHMVQNTPNWSAKECARLRDKTQLTSKV